MFPETYSCLTVWGHIQFQTSQKKTKNTCNKHTNREIQLKVLLEPADRETETGPRGGPQHVTCHSPSVLECRFLLVFWWNFLQSPGFVRILPRPLKLGIEYLKKKKSYNQSPFIQKLKMEKEVPSFIINYQINMCQGEKQTQKEYDKYIINK